jgi:antitoxin component of RelBE/YafQ-DinJ toxin-antitoxin module
VYLDEQVQAYLTARAEEKGIDLSDLVNTMLMRDIEIIEAVK